ncbi:uncharacterized protein LOC133373198 [Rhineura floridana]|uniref:uncharacterized protein LOC133373198 n=1 Tax=Rhineura floridana TaxID=261503 RepID=UPI002AC8649A|nr:uncharacterized protein LOC133373198 [Rhineura floridana]
MTTKAKRIKFSDEEKFLILEEFALRKDILIAKSGRCSNTTDRQRAWEEIAAAVNSLNPLIQRTPEEIRKKWKNMVVDARKGLTVEKHPLLRRQPRERLFHNIFALLNQTDNALPNPLLYGCRLRNEPSGSPPGSASPTRRTEVPSGSPCILYLRSNSHYQQPCKIEALRDSKASKESLRIESPRQNLGAIAPLQYGEGLDCHTEGCQESEGKALGEPCKGVSLNCVHHADEPHHGQIPRMHLPLSHESGGSGVYRIPGPRICSSDLTLTCKLERPLSPVQEWPCLRAACSPLTQSSGISSLGPESTHSSTDDNAEDSQPDQRGCNMPTGGPSRELSEKQSRLYAEVLELQKETLQLQKEKILLEKEKLLLEILKLRRELGM